jgi:DNA polymerase-3 subunit gamma/tau
MLAAEPVASAGPRLSTFRDVVALLSEQKEATLHAHLLHSVHLVRFAPPVIELRPQPEAPKDLSARLAAVLSRATGTRWTIAVSRESGEATIAEQGNAADTARKTAAADHPLVRAIMAAFPGARIDTVHDKTADAYGLPAAAAPSPNAPAFVPNDTPAFVPNDMPAFVPNDMPEFAPPEADYFDEDTMETDL